MLGSCGTIPVRTHRRLESAKELGRVEMLAEDESYEALVWRDGTLEATRRITIQALRRTAPRNCWDAGTVSLTSAATVTFVFALEMVARSSSCADAA